MLIIDAENSILGRLASYVATRLLEGEEVVIVNAEKSVISGRPRRIYEKYYQYASRRTKTNPLKGPFFPKSADQIVKRTVRGMLPYKRPRGRDAYRRLRVYVGTPAEIVEEKALLHIPGAEANQLRSPYTTVGRIASRLRGRLIPEE